MPPLLDRDASRPVYLSIYHYYREQILRGSLPGEAKLPSIRALAQHLGISRNPVETAYAHLVAEGYVTNRPRSGYMAVPVTALPDAGELFGVRGLSPFLDSSEPSIACGLSSFPDASKSSGMHGLSPSLEANKPSGANRLSPSLEANKLSGARGLVSPFQDANTLVKAPAALSTSAFEAPLQGPESGVLPSLPTESPIPLSVDFAYDAIAHEGFPLRVWTRLTQRAIRQAGGDLFRYGDGKGELGLRRLIRSYVKQKRGVSCDPEQIIVTAGTQHAAILLGQLLSGDSRPLGVEAAMHPGLYRIFARQRLAPQPILLEHDGISCDALERGGELCGVYLTPSHQFPYGSILPAAKRVRLLQWAADRRAWLIEDDYDSEFVYDGRPLPALQGMDRDGRVIYMGTFSKALAPSLRLGFLVLPPALLERYEREFAGDDGTVSRLTQFAMAAFMEEGHLERHVRRMRTIYNDNREALLAAAAHHFQGAAAVSGVGSGLHALLGYETSLTVAELLARSRQAGIGIRPASDFHVRANTEVYPPFGPFVLGYGGLTQAQIAEGLHGLSRAWLQESGM
ncbi:PLP-dependent aminotransferase family protein [Paenibacillus aurantiacus]|uniref:PLP-dependent aminotransferase family protein n=1 Tax=Paenibacillus aurantiacus TaxID=1936118 RepID=A0ABV5L2Z0_9BACL